jgi:hypothetical protein
MLYARGVFINQCYDELNTRAPDLVRAVHAEYAKAGAEVLETNTFGANGEADPVRSQTHTGDFTAPRAIARDVAGDSPGRRRGGTVRCPTEPYGPTSNEEARAAFAEQMAALKEGGADLFIIETFGDLEEIGQAVQAARDVDPLMPVVAQMTITDGHTRSAPLPRSRELADGRRRRHRVELLRDRRDPRGRRADARDLPQAERASTPALPRTGGAMPCQRGVWPLRATPRRRAPSSAVPRHDARAHPCYCRRRAAAAPAEGRQRLT